MKKAVLLLMAFMMALILSGCGSEESKAVEEFKDTAKEVSKIEVSGKSNVQIARELVQKTYNTACKIHKVSEPLNAEEEKLMAAYKLAQAKATLGYIDRGNENFFSLIDQKSADKVKKDMEPATKNLKEWREKHKEYIQAEHEYNVAIGNVINAANERRNEDYYITIFLPTFAHRLARDNNYTNMKFSDADMKKYEFVTVNNEKQKKKEIAQYVQENEKIAQAFGPSNGQNSYVVNSAPQVKKQKMFNPIDTHQSDAIMKGVSGTSSSSALKDGDTVYSASNIVDMNGHTCWADGVAGLGIGESITINFNQKYNISGFRIFNGYQKTQDLFNKNSRPTALRVIGSDGSNEVYNIEDSIYEQDIYFDKMISVNSIKLVIEKVARGSKYEDTCISEVIFF